MLNLSKCSIKERKTEIYDINVSLAVNLYEKTKGSGQKMQGL